MERLFGCDPGKRQLLLSERLDVVDARRDDGEVRRGTVGAALGGVQQPA